MTRPKFTRIALLLALAFTIAAPVSAAAPQNDAGSGADAGNTFETATPVFPAGRYEGKLDRLGGDVDDFYRFPVAQGGSVSVLITLTNSNTDPIRILDPNGVPVDVSRRASGATLSHGAILTSEGSAMRLHVHRAPLGGEYRLQLQGVNFDIPSYLLCFMNCEEPRQDGSELIFGGSLKFPSTKVLLVPPSHGDMGNPLGPTVVDYLQATLRGMHVWTKAIDAFIADFPEYSYLDQITVHVEIFDGAKPVDPAGFDVIVGYVAAGPVFRGVASDTDPDFVEDFIDYLGFEKTVHYSGRVIALSLFGSSPRAGQVVYDFPEVSDLEIVTAHEFGHTFGVGHTKWWDPVLGPDLMNSPAPFVYGDGSPAGDGGERTKMKCLSSLNLLALAELYSWLPEGRWQGNGGTTSLPEGMPYKWYC